MTPTRLHIFRVISISTICVLLLASLALSQDEATPTTNLSTEIDTVIIEVAAPTSLIATDHKYDNGERINLQWVPSIDDLPGISTVVGYRIYRQDDGGAAEAIADLPAKANHYRDENTELGHTYIYSVAALTDGAEFVSNPTESISPEREWIDFSKRYLFLIALIVGGAVIYFIEIARRGKKLFVRKIAGLEAVDDAVGRATEMGRPILFIPGIQDMDDVQTLAGLTILGRISKTIADYDTEIFMPVSRSLVMTAGREIIKSSYQTAGRPDKYSDDMVTYITDEQFGYVAAVDGIMVREKPATIFLLGAFFAESLILAETGNYIGAIQIAGTARPAQLPFFIAACDFTLIGEELFAASAYLSGEPKQLGSLKGQDVGKAIAMVILVIGALATTIGTAWNIASMNSLVDILKTIFSTS